MAQSVGLVVLVVGLRYCAVKEEKSDVLYIIADAFREKLSQILGQELSIVAQFDGKCFEHYLLYLLFLGMEGH